MKNIIIVFQIFLILSACSTEEKMKEQEILDTSEQVAIKYMKREYGLDFVVKSVEFTPMGVVDVDGYDKADKENEITVTINQGDNYDVSGVGYMKDLPNSKTLKEAD